MADEFIYAGGRLDNFAITGSPLELTTAGYFDSAYADCAVRLFTGDSVVAGFVTASGTGATSGTTVVTGETLWVHAEIYFNGATNSVTVDNQTVIELRDGAGLPWFAIRTITADAEHGLFYNSNTGASPIWTQIGPSWLAVRGFKITHDIKLTLGSPHVLQYSQNNNIFHSGNFTQALLTALGSVRFSGTANSTINGTTYLSQVLCSRNLSTIAAKVHYSRPSGAGFHTAWTGAFSNVNEAINSDATFDVTGSAGLKQSYPMGDVTVPLGYAIRTVFLAARGKNDGAAPNNLKSLLRSGGVDYSTANLAGIGTSFGPLLARYNNDPATAAGWTEAGWNAVQAGYESAT